MLSGSHFYFMEFHLIEPQTIPINRRAFLSLGLSAPIGTLSASHHVASAGLFPVSMQRCVVVTKGRLVLRRFDAPEVSQDWTDFVCGPQSPTWHCKIALEGEHWWLIISQTENRQPHLTVIQPLSAVPENAGLLAARITFRLHSLQRRGSFQCDLNKHRIVQRVNQQILRAMDNMPI